MTPPEVSVILAAHDAERFVGPAVESVLRQTLRDLELIVIDDGSTDATADVLAGIFDSRLTVLRNAERRGLAASLNLGLDRSSGRYLARLDADDVAMPNRLERQLAHIRATPGTAILGSAVCELSAGGRLGAVHAMPSTAGAVRWQLLFGSPFFHPTVLLDRQRLDREQLRYDPRFLESEDYDLWARLLDSAEGANLDEPLVLYRVHEGQASRRRRPLQRSFQVEIARREIERVAPELSAEDAELAWSIGAGESPSPDRLDDAASAFLALVDAFESRFPEARRSISEAAARSLLRTTVAAAGGRTTLVRRALELDPALPLRAGTARASRLGRERRVHRAGRAWLETVDLQQGDGRAIRVTAVFPEPTPYRTPLLDRVAAQPELDLTVIYAAPTVAGSAWAGERRHRAVQLRGVRIPGAERLVRHDYPFTPGVVAALTRARPDVVVVSGWSTFAAQAAIAWCRGRRTPYVLVVESHDQGPRAGWRRAVKGRVVPPLVAGASSVLVTGTLARRSMLARGASQERIGIFANTIDVARFGERAELLAGRRDELREEIGIGAEDIAVLSVARLALEKRLDTLIRAIAVAADPRLVLVLAGEGPERVSLQKLAGELGVRLVLAGARPWERIVDVYVAADVFALVSERETWAVVVNEAAACGLPLVLSDRVGAAHDLLRDGENGVLVSPGDVKGIAAALGRLAADPEKRRRMGARSRELVRDWGYEPSVEGFLAAVRDAADHRRR